MEADWSAFRRGQFEAKVLNSGTPPLATDPDVEKCATVFVDIPKGAYGVVQWSSNGRVVAILKKEFVLMCKK